MRRVLVVGGGFGGIHAIQVLQEALAPRRKVSLTLVSAKSHFTFKPLLPNAAAGDIDPTSISIPIEDLLTEKTEFVTDRIERIDLDESIAVGAGTYEFDYLLLAPGAVVDWTSRKWDSDPSVLAMHDVRDAVATFDRIKALVEEAVAIPDEEERSRLLTFVVAGGGPTGVSLLSELQTAIEEDYLADYPMLRNSVRFVLVEPRPSVLPRLDAGLRRLVQDALIRENVDLKLGERVVHKKGDEVLLESGETIVAATLFWCAGVHASPLLKSCGIELDQAGRIPVFSTMKARGVDREGIYVVGDSAGIGEMPWTAQIASEQGVVAAENILADLTGRKRREWDYEYDADIITLGRRNAAATYRGRSFEGRAARALYRAIYTALVPSAMRKILVLRDWVSSDMRNRSRERKLLESEGTD